EDGTSCGSPQMRKHIYCYAHRQMMEARALALRLPALEDANAIQISLMRVQKALIDDTITAKKAGLLLYSLQLAVTNIGQTTFGEADERELVTDVVDEEEALGRNQNPLTTEDTEQHGERLAEQAEPGTTGTDDLGQRRPVKSEKDTAWRELPESEMSATAAPGSFDAHPIAGKPPASEAAYAPSLSRKCGIARACS